ncbi:receptor-type tyrosine-protein phosphatase mu-like [Magallana gigas]|uniref:receptor-type tyrosine-protein phosphatase mu-like n=1 Tax=Magallana gigas TaxID=29159 RepID=UPI00333EBD9E
MVVHSSAGIGRTGTFIALNYLVQQAKESGYVDVFECVETLRRQRLNMVQTLEQYKFLHNTTLQALMCTSSDPSASNFPQIYEDLLKVDAETGKRNIDLNLENLNVALSTLPGSAYSMAKKLYKQKEKPIQ